MLGLEAWDWAGAEREFLRALELNPASADAHGAYATACLMPQGRFEQATAFRYLDEAFRVYDPQIVWIKVDPRFAKIRSDPRFQPYLSKLKL